MERAFKWAIVLLTLRFEALELQRSLELVVLPVIAGFSSTSLDSRMRAIANGAEEKSNKVLRLWDNLW